MLFPTTFIFTSEKIGVGLEKQTAIFLFQFHPEMCSPVFLFYFFSRAIWRYFQPSGLWNLTYQIRRTATYIYVEIHKMLNFPSICSGNWNMCAEYALRGRLSLTWALTLTGTRCQLSGVWLKGLIIAYGNISHYQNAPHFKTCRFRPYQFQNIPFTYKHISFTYKQSNTMKGFANETACINRVLICHVCIYLKFSIEQNHIKVSFYCHKKSLCDV